MPRDLEINYTSTAPRILFYLIIISITHQRSSSVHPWAYKINEHRFPDKSANFVYSGEITFWVFQIKPTNRLTEENCVQRRILRPNTKETHTPRARKKSTYRQWSTQAYVMSQSNFHFILSPSLLSVFDSNRTRHCSYCSVWTQCACCALRRRLL